MIRFVENQNGNCRLCSEPDHKQDMVECDDCDRWFHIGCVNLTVAPTAEEKWICPKCVQIQQRLASLEISARKKDEQIKQQLDAMDKLMATMKGQCSTSSSGQVTNQPTDRSFTQTVSMSSDWTIYLKRLSLTTLPRFSGASKDWPKFKKTFHDTTAEGGFSNLENLNRLEQVLKGDAYKTVQQLMINSENVPKIIEKLEECFGRKDLVYKELLNDLRRIKKDSRTVVPDISDALDNMVVNMEALGQKEYLRDHRLIEEIIEKLPYTIQVKWVEVIQSNTSIPTLNDLNKWLLPHSRIARMMPKSNNSVSTTERKPRVNVHQTMKCALCSASHRLFQCKNFKQMKTLERREFLAKKGICFKCLNSNDHIMRNCSMKGICGIDGCNKEHNRLLHQRSEYKRNQDTAADVRRGPEETTNIHRQRKEHLYYQIVPITVQNGERMIDTYAFLDTGSSVTLLDERMANMLELEGKVDPLTWTQDCLKSCSSKRVKFWIKGIGKPVMARTMHDLNLPIQTVDMEQIAKNYPYLKDIPLQDYKEAQPTLLIGLDNSELLSAIKTVKGNGPMAVKTRLGWVIYGKEYNINRQDYTMVIQEEQEMSKMMQRYFSIDDFGVKLVKKLPRSPEEERAQQILDNTIKLKDNRYEVGLLWKTKDVQFPDSYHTALRRLVIMENKLKQDEKLKDWAINTFADYVKKGYARKLAHSELINAVPRTYYLPHFIVHNQNKIPPKPRLVFDAASKINGVSFNSNLLSGPDATTSLVGVLLRFREGRIAVCGDIQEMFHQVKIKPEDQHAQRFLWRDCENNREPDVYIMEVMIFGSTCSPSCAQAVKNKNAAAFMESKPKAALAIEKQHYVDDYLDSFTNIREATAITKDVIDIHQHGGFFIRNFISNSKELLSNLSSDRIQSTDIKVIEDKDSCAEKVLGVYWNTKLDLIGYRLSLKKLSNEVRQTLRLPTKREVLAFVMSLYDPLGLISNYTIMGKILLQELHKDELDWDDEVPKHLSKQWQNWLAKIQQASNVKIPRCIIPDGAGKLELHTFVDASERAYAAVIYLRCIANGSVYIRLLAAKAKVGPIHQLSIPKMELQAALLGTRLTNTIQNEQRIKIDSITYWTDSENVLSWLQPKNRRYKIFVTHRVAEVLDTTNIQQWRYIPSELNPADEATKDFKGQSIWTKGPQFLKKPVIEYPNRKIKESTEELRQVVGLHQTSSIFIGIKRYSSWNVL
ncbi:uncharacterized protein LOC129765875 [Toxorhynchites rutilus septentrionalis]|uniref:uncharacterized protein LOC129765875 n=1 Tax=Toxorhynchites rutilus septentrionalis TaxID=329112 RepID=UPI002478B47A|nr:uncharacterized protein LOC129765875 [Toxorhynchites rutilus septentrionalis]